MLICILVFDWVLTAADLILEFEEIGFIRPSISTCQVPRSFQQFSLSSSPLSKSTASSNVDLTENPSSEPEATSVPSRSTTESSDRSDNPLTYELQAVTDDTLLSTSCSITELKSTPRVNDKMFKTIVSTRPRFLSDVLTYTNDREAWIDLIVLLSSSRIFIGQKVSQQQMLLERNRAVECLVSLKVSC